MLLDFLAALEQKVGEIISNIGELFWEFGDWEYGERIFNRINKKQEDKIKKT